MKNTVVIEAQEDFETILECEANKEEEPEVVSVGPMQKVESVDSLGSLGSEKTPSTYEMKLL